VRKDRPAPQLHPRVGLGVLALAWFLVGKADDVTVGRSLRLVAIALVVVDFVWSVVRCRRASVRVVAQPTMAFVGDDPELDVDVRGAGSGIAMTMTSSPDAPSVVAYGDSVGRLPGRAHFRGVAREVRINLRAYGPLALMGYSRTFTFAIRPLFIGPRPLEPDLAVPIGAGRLDGDGPPDLGDTIPSSVREYRPGDSWRRIAWPVSARAGRLVTREYERDTAPVVRVLLDLGLEPGPDAERAAAIAAWVGREVLSQGRRLHVVTLDEDRRVAGGEVDAARLHRVLAAATCGPVTVPDAERILIIRPDGISWR
jgi:uncharacterized protein (DUF58 family)